MKANRLSGTLFAVASALAIILCLIIVIYTVPGLRPLFTYPGFRYLRFEETGDGTLNVKYCSRYADEVEILSRVGGKAVTDRRTRVPRLQKFGRADTARQYFNYRRKRV